MADIRGVSSATSPYEAGSYTAKSNAKNTLTIESYFKLLSAQLAHQDMSNPMDNSEMMAQMTQMAMVQSLGTMTSNMKEEMALTKTTYLAGLIGKDVTVKVPDADKNPDPNAPKEKSGIIASVNMKGNEATFRIEGDTTEYPLESLLQIGKLSTGTATTAATAVNATGTQSTAAGAATAGAAPAGVQASHSTTSTAGAQASHGTTSAVAGTSNTATPLSAGGAATPSSVGAGTAPASGAQTAPAAGTHTGAQSTTEIGPGVGLQSNAVTGTSGSPSTSTSA
ncbi:hypothetical protein HMPREF9624_01635 [Oribacterium asaccharolyticum ACB7]|uniref:Basal-body rod modification protein FlgD n=1 Tax=Oribacterium asaccharolyticum ACB7 TaxID=796944 RepID=G9WRB9_9FIRM|nr:flagellar hook capping FlgD N-terminal domain-containing protein [Oribacterium asaccharolyticum]EHL14306.1 hypothetical protein HMPREF9624_01635 [Oribacterium asaccharolyticum ACB7]